MATPSFGEGMFYREGKLLVKPFEVLDSRSGSCSRECKKDSKALHFSPRAPEDALRTERLVDIV